MTHARPPFIFKLTRGAATRLITLDGPDFPRREDDDAPVRCRLFRPGHNVHVVQGRLGLTSPSTPWRLLDVTGHHVHVEDADGNEARWWLHETDALVAALSVMGDPIIDLHGFALARIGDSLFTPDVAGEGSPCLAPDETPSDG